MFFTKTNNKKLFYLLFNRFRAIKNINNNLNGDRSVKFFATIPECPKPGMLDGIISLINYDKAMKLHEIVDNKHRELGPIYRDHIGSVSAYFVNSPEDYRKVFKNEGPTPMHFLPEAWLIYNKSKKCSRGLLFM